MFNHLHKVQEQIFHACALLQRVVKVAWLNMWPSCKIFSETALLEAHIKIKI